MTKIDAHLAAGLARRFRLVRQLGQGGMGAVFLAEQIAVGNRPVALKVLLRKLLDDPDFLQRFQNEAASTGRIRHPNVVTIYESGQGDDGTPYIAMEYLEGEPLRHTLKRRGALPVAECAEILQQAARGLNAAHKLGIIHRDLKPDNIFLTHGDESVALASSPAQAVRAPSVGARDIGAGPVPGRDVGAPLVGALPVGSDDEHATYHGHPARARAWPGWPWHDEHPANVVVKIVDFGIAKLRESAMHTLTGTVLGTPAYMSYEQASGMKSDELDARSDIYSLGVVAYEMLTGRLPFESHTPVGYLRKHLQDAPPPLRAVKPDLPNLPEVEKVVMKALTKDRDQRYSSVLEFANAFAEAAEPAPEAVGAVREPPLRAQGTMSPSPAPLAAPSDPRRQAVKLQRTLVPARPAPPRRKWFVVGCLIFLLVASAAGFWYWQMSGFRPGERLFESPAATTFSPFVLERTLTGHEGGVLSVAFSPDGKLLAAGSEDHTIKLWDVSTGTLFQALTGHTGAVWSVAISADGKNLASGSNDGTVGFWDVPEDWFVANAPGAGGPRQKLRGNSNSVRSVAFSPDGKLLASGGWGRTVKLWDVHTGALRRTLGVGALGAVSVAFSPDGKLLASGGEDRTIKLWDVDSAMLRQTLTGHGLSVASVAFSPSGELLASGSDDRTVKLWDVGTGKLKQTLTGHADTVESVTFNPDGKLLASASADKSIRLWDVASGVVRQTLTGQSGIVESVAFSPDGKLLAAGSEDRSIKLWRCEPNVTTSVGNVNNPLTSPPPAPVEAPVKELGPSEKPPVPAKLSETLQWLKGASEKESSDGTTHITFDSNGGDSCAVTITETRAKASPGFWIRESFSLADIDPEDIQAENLGTGASKQVLAGEYGVRFHTTNYAKKIIDTEWNLNEPIPASDYTLITNEWFGPKFAKAFKQAVELCGGKRSSF